MDDLSKDIQRELIEERNNPPTPILIVDDEAPIRRILSRVLGGNGNKCSLASSAQEARARLLEQHFDLILCDVKMPGESGIDFIRYVFDEYHETAVIMITAVDDPELVETALNLGAYGYIIKPFEPSEVMINVWNALKRRKLEIQNRVHRENLKREVLERTKALRTALDDLQGTIKDTVQAMAAAVEIRDPYTAGHQRRVADFASAIAEEMGLPVEQAAGVRMAGVIHDLGKIAIPSEILSKPGQLTDLEFGLIKTHPQAGYDILKNIRFPWPIAQIIIQHHERIDGSGYPKGLKGDDILLEAKIIAVSDVVEAMASHRPYRPALGIDRALEDISDNRGVFYDPEVVDACVKLLINKGSGWHGWEEKG